MRWIGGRIGIRGREATAEDFFDFVAEIFIVTTCPLKPIFGDQTAVQFLVQPGGKALIFEQEVIGSCEPVHSISSNCLKMNEIKKNCL